MPVYAVTYIYTEDSTGRDEHRPAHKDFLGRLGELGMNRASGPFGPDEAPGALILMSAESKQHALAATEEDPFRVNGLVASVTASEWIPMMGPLADKI